MIGPNTDKTLRCYGCDFLHTWWNGGFTLFAKCRKKDEFIDGNHRPGGVDEIKTPDWCPSIQEE